MDGKQLRYQVRQLLQEGTTSTFVDDRTTYNYLYEAACEMVSALRILTNTQTITTVAGENLYNINADFLCLDVKNDYAEYVIKYYNGTSTYWINYRDPNFMYQSESASDQSIPDNFSIVDKQTNIANVTGTATAAGTATGGESTLTDSLAPFTDVSAGDLVHNTDDGSDGVVLEVTSTSVLKTALFDGTNNDWSENDDYIIVPQSRKQIYIDPPTLTSGHVISIKYICRPAPVYSDYRTYRIPDQYMPAVCKYAAWLYKYRDREPNFGDVWYKNWDMQLRKASMNENRNPSKIKFGVNMRKRVYSNRSMR